MITRTPKCLAGGLKLSLCAVLAASIADAAGAQEVLDQQNPASAFTCLNPSFYTMSQGFTPTFSRLNFAEIHLDANKGGGGNGDFTLRIKRNGVLQRESDHLIIDAVPGMDSDYYRFNFPSEAILSPGQAYELELVNHSGTGFFAWCQSQTNSYAGGAPVVTPAGGGSGDFLFRTGMQSIYGPPQATNNGNGYLLFESALAPLTPPSGGGVTVSNSFYTGVNFEVAQPSRLSRIGGYFSNSGQVFGAVVQATGFASKPNPANLTGADVLATTTINVPTGGGDAWGNVDVELQPGWYGVIFGTGRFGVPAASNGFDDLGQPNGPYWNPYSLRQSDGLQIFQGVDVRIFGQAAQEVGKMQQRPVFDTQAEKFAGQWILTDGDRDIAPYRFDFNGTDARGLMEFDLSQVPAGATITSAKISLDPDQLSTGGSSMSRLHFHGYSGDGVATPADAAVPLNAIGSSAVITQFQVFDTSLSASYVQSLVNQGATHLGLMVRGDVSGARFNFRSWEYGTPESAPLLTIEYTLPGDFNGDTFVNGEDYQEWTGRFGADLDGRDFLAWQRGFDGSSSAAAVPEPNTIGLVVVFALLGAALPSSTARRAPA